MSLLTESDRRKIKEYLLPRMRDPVIIRLYTRSVSCESCPVAESLARELKELALPLQIDISNPYVSKNEKIEEVHLPLFSLMSKKSNGKSLYYYGTPSGLEFSVFLEAIVSLSQENPTLYPELPQLLQRVDLPKELDFKVFVTSTCIYCPRMAMLVYSLALLTEKVTASVISAEEFPEWSREYGVRGVPKTIVNNRFALEGAIPPALFLEEIKNFFEHSASRR